MYVPHGNLLAVTNLSYQYDLSMSNNVARNRLKRR